MLSDSHPTQISRFTCIGLTADTKHDLTAFEPVYRDDMARTEMSAGVDELNGKITAFHQTRKDYYTGLLTRRLQEIPKEVEAMANMVELESYFLERLPLKLNLASSAGMAGSQTDGGELHDQVKEAVQSQWDEFRAEGKFKNTAWTASADSYFRQHSVSFNQGSTLSLPVSLKAILPGDTHDRLVSHFKISGHPIPSRNRPAPAEHIDHVMAWLPTQVTVGSAEATGAPFVENEVCLSYAPMYFKMRSLAVLLRQNAAATADMMTDIGLKRGLLDRGTLPTDWSDFANYTKRFWMG